MSFEFTPIGTYFRVDPKHWDQVLLKDGVLVDRRNGTPMEMDGYGAYQALMAMELQTGRSTRDDRQRIVDALLRRQQACGGLWVSGVWTGSPREVHCRFTAAALRTLVQAVVDGLPVDVSLVLDLLKQHLALREDLTIGPWFLHDGIEPADSGLTFGEPPHPSKLWSKTENNCLVLNTHIDTLVTLLDALERLPMPEPVRTELEALARAAIGTFWRVVDLRMQGAGYRLFEGLDAALRRFMLRVDGTKNRYLNFIKWRVIEQYYARRARIKVGQPTFRYRDGFLERDICMSGYYFFYHVVNLHDIGRLAVIGHRMGYVDRSGFERLAALVHGAIDYAVRDPYRAYLLDTLQKDGRATTLVEGMLLRAGMSDGFEWPQAWRAAARHIIAACPPSPAMLGFDPFVIRDARREGDGMAYTLLNGQTTRL